jgi:uncharacterized Zn finger protein
MARRVRGERVPDRGDSYPFGTLVQRGGRDLTVVASVVGKAGRGYYRVLATEDAGPIASGWCTCPAGAPTVPAAEIVTEDEFEVCGSCRMQRRGA